jgi:hypothetical protein
LYDALVNLDGLKVVWLKLIFSLFDFRVIAVIIIFSIFRTFRILRRVSFALYLLVLDDLDRFSALGGFLLFFFEVGKGVDSLGLLGVAHAFK